MELSGRHSCRICEGVSTVNHKKNMTTKEMPDEFRTTPLATRIIIGLLTILFGGVTFWCVRVTNQLDSLITSNGKVETLTKKVEEHGQYLQILFEENSKMKIENSGNSSTVTGLVKDVDLLKTKVFK